MNEIVNYPPLLENGEHLDRQTFHRRIRSLQFRFARVAPMLHPGENVWLDLVVSNLLDHDVKLVYADWLEERGDVRSAFLRKYVKTLRSMDAADLPNDEGLDATWIELIGFPLVKQLLDTGFPELRDTVLRLARPALRMKTGEMADESIPLGGSKIGGLPDLPAGFAWPIGADCRAIYNDDTEGVEELAGFVAQVNLGEIAHTQAARVVPKTGVLSFFCFQDIENDNPDVIGVKALYFGEAERLVRSEPPQELTEGNATMPARRLSFEETLDLPDYYSGPWSEEFHRNRERDCADALDWFRDRNFENVLGYGRATSGDDPTPSKQSRHLIQLENSVECRLHIQIAEQDLAASNFDAIRLVWVDFD